MKIINRPKRDISFTNLVFFIKGNFKKILTVLIASLLLLSFYLAIFVFQLPRIKSLNISGNINVSTEDITNQIDKYIGKGYFTTDLDREANQITSKYPFIDKVYISKSFPSSIDVRIVERVPRIVLNTDEKCILLSDQSVVISISDVENSRCNTIVNQYSVIELESNDIVSTFEVGKQSSFMLVKELINVSSLLDSFGYKLQVCSYDNDVLKCYVQNGKQFIFSSAQSFEMQDVRLVAVLEEIGRSRIKFKVLDLRYKRPVIQQ